MLGVVEPVDLRACVLEELRVDSQVEHRQAGVLLLGLIFNILNFENGMGWISLSAYWQSVIRGGFLLLVVILQAKLLSREEAA